MLRATTLISAAFILTIALLSACGDDDDGSNSLRLPSCSDLSSIESYRYNLNLALDIPGIGDDTEDPSPSVDPLTAFSDALTALFSDMQLEGAYVAPDRTQVILTFEGEELEWRSIGDQSWIRFEDEWEEQDSSSDDDILTPQVVCEDIVNDLSTSLDDLTAAEETVNGVRTLHYSIGRDDISQLPDLLGGANTTDIPEDMQFDIWLAQDGLWLMKIDVKATDTSEDGQPVGLSLAMELRDVNDSDVAIEPPEDGE
jgi:hypothetical protein